MKWSLSLLGSCFVLCAGQIVQAQTIREQIDAILLRPAVAANTWTILVQNDVGTVTYYDRNPTLGQMPASNTKLFTMAAAFSLLGTNHYFESRVYGNGSMTNGTLSGDLNLVSEHDMTWNESVFGTGNARKGLDYIAAKLKTQGVTHILGNIQCYGVCYYLRPSADTAHNSQSQSVYNADTATAFLAALQAQGISVSGSALGQIGFNPPGSLLYTHKSSDLNYGGKPLTLDVACIPLAKVSHNVMADELLRHIGYKLNGVDSFGTGSALVFNWLQNTVGISTNGMVMNDGSGLSHGNRFSALQIDRLFRYMLSAYVSWPILFPIGCVDGTLSSRFCNADTSGRVHAKTGSLTPAIALSGYIDNKYSGRRFLFSFLSNSSSSIDQTATRAAIDDCVTLFGAPTLNCIDPANLGKGDWIWRVPDSITATGVTNVQGLINYEQAKGMQWITVKCGDGNTIWSQFDSNVVAQSHAAGLKVFAWAYAYGGAANPNNPSDVAGEINVALNALSMGADGFIIDAESEYETLGVTNAALAAQQYCQGIRASFPNTFLAHAPFVSFNSVRTNLYRSFGKYCDAVMPQAYYDFSGVSVSNMVPRLDLQWTTAQNLWVATGYYDSVKPIAPVGWGASPSVGSEITAFVDLLKNDTAPATAGGYKGVSFWSCQSHTADIWDAIANVTIGNLSGIPAPNFLLATASTSSRIDLSWEDNSSTEVGFKIERALNSSGPWSQIAFVNTDVTNYSDLNLAAGTTFFYQVRASSTNGDSTYSNVANAATLRAAAPILNALPDTSVNVMQTLSITNAAVPGDVELTNTITDFETSSGSLVMFQAPNYSGSTSTYLDTNTASSSSIVTNFPIGHTGSKVLKGSWSFATGKTGSWLRFTTFNSVGYPNPTIDFNNTLQFDIYTDKALKLGLGLRETSTTVAIGSNGGTSGSIEFSGVTSRTSTQTPNPTRTINAGTWTTARFNIPQEPVTAFSSSIGNGILESTTGKGGLEDLAFVPAGGTGAYNVYLDNFQVVKPNVLTFSLDPGAPVGATINPVSGVISWTPSASQGPATYFITVRVTDSNTPPLSDAKTFSVTVNKTISTSIAASMSNNQLHIQFAADPGVAYTIQTATNLINPMDWQTILVTNSSSSAIDFVEAGMTNGPQRFYRVLSR